MTYQELLDQSTHWAGKLAHLGVARRDKVALVAKSGLLYAVGVHALMQLDGILMPVNWRLNPSEVAWQLRDAGIQVLLFDQDCEAYVAEVNRELGGQMQACCLRLESIATPQVSRSHIDLLRTHAIIYTSGTTGHPKGTLLTYQNHFWSAISSGLQLGVLPTDKWLVPMPLFHVGGLAVLMRSVIYGTTAVIQDHFDVETVNATLDRGDISMVSLVPVMLQRMLVNRSKAYAPRLRCILLGGSAAPRPLLETCQALRIPVAQSYGLTETDSQVATLQPADGLRKLGSSGKPLLPTEIAIVDGDNRLPHGEVGEIAVKGPTVTSGYLNRPDTTRDAIRNGWLHTGDIGYLDEDGYLYVLDRRSDLIVSGGENIYPAEVESALTAHEAVLEAAVTGKSDETWAAVPVAFVKLRVGVTVTPEELQVFCRTRLGGYKVPKEIYFVQELPRNAGGKLLRRKLKDWVNS